MADRRFFMRSNGGQCQPAEEENERSFWEVLGDIFVAIFAWFITFILIVTLLSFLLSMIGLLLAALKLAAWLSTLISALIFAGLFGWWMYEITTATIIRIAVIVDRANPG